MAGLLDSVEEYVQQVWDKHGFGVDDEDTADRDGQRSQSPLTDGRKGQLDEATTSSSGMVELDALTLSVFAKSVRLASFST